MAILIEGMKCSLCGKPMTKGEETISFSAFVSNEADPLVRFSDGIFHVECFRKHPSAHAVEARYAEVREKNKPENRRCVVCGKSISDPDDFFSLGYLTDEVSHPLYRLNCTHLHRSCLNRWSELTTVSALAQKQLESGAWSGEGMRWLLKILKNAQIK
jgi:predicted nucleic acid-binding Zn ribbon protein